MVFGKSTGTPTDSKGKIYVTGKVEGHTKQDLEERVVKLGFTWSKSVSKQLMYLVAGNNPGGKKIDKALELDVKILTWSEFIDKYGN